MQNSLLQKIYLGAIILLFAGTVGYGGWVVVVEQKDAITSEITSTEQTESDQEAISGWKEYSESDFVTEIPSDWNGCVVYGGMLYVEYAISKEEISCGYEYDIDPMLEAVFISVSSGRTVGGSEGASLASAQEEAEEGAKEKKIITVSGREATLYFYEDGSAEVLVVGDLYAGYDYAAREMVEDGYATFYTISTYHYDDPEIQTVFNRIIETFEIQEIQ